MTREERIHKPKQGGGNPPPDQSDRGMLSFTGGPGGKHRGAATLASPPLSFLPASAQPSVHARQAKIDNEECQPRKRKSPLPRSSRSGALAHIPQQQRVIYCNQKRQVF